MLTSFLSIVDEAAGSGGDFSFVVLSADCIVVGTSFSDADFIFIVGVWDFLNVGLVIDSLLCEVVGVRVSVVFVLVVAVAVELADRLDVDCPSAAKRFARKSDALKDEAAVEFSTRR